MTGQDDAERRPPDEPEPEPLPELRERPLDDPGVGDLSRSDYVAVVKRTGKEFLDDNVTMTASALAYSSFLAIPSALLVVTGLFTLIAGAGTISTLVHHFGNVVPHQTVVLLDSSLQRLNDNPSASVVMTIVGFVLALWSTTGAMTTFITGMNIAYDRKDTRSFLKKRLVAVQMVFAIIFAFVLIFVLLVLGPQIERFIGGKLGIQGVLSWLWWIAEWPLLVGGLMLAFAALLYWGPDVEHPRWQFVSPGAVVAVAVWLAASGGFAVYTSLFGSYNKTWGSLAAVIIMLTWLWLTGIALLIGAELNAEVERSRELRRQETAEPDLTKPARPY